MKKETISGILNEIDDRYIAEASVHSVNTDNKTDLKRSIFHNGKDRQKRIRWSAVAACLAIMVIGSVTYAFASEAIEYNKALSFFEDNGLSTDGLNRSEIKEVYRDITNKRFSSETTLSVIKNSVLGWEIPEHEPTPEELSAIWDKKTFINSISHNGISFRIDPQYVYDKQKGLEILDKSIVSCYQDEKLLWQSEFNGLDAEEYTYTDNGTVVWGVNDTSVSNGKIYSWIACIDNKGKILWKQIIDHEFDYEYIGSVLRNNDGTWAVISRGDMKYLCLSIYDEKGNELSFNKTEVGNLGIWNAANLGDGYIIQLGNKMSHDTALLYKMDRNGIITDSFSYEEKDSEYYIQDMIVFEGQIYLSAYAVPKQNDGGGRHEIADILNHVFSTENHDISSEELTSLLKDNYTAVLLICDPEGGTPVTFYSEKGSLGSRLNVNDSGDLEWYVDSFTSSYYSPATSAYTISASCKELCYIFNSKSSLIGQTETGNNSIYRR